VSQLQCNNSLWRAALDLVRTRVTKQLVLGPILPYTTRGSSASTPCRKNEPRRATIKTDSLSSKLSVLVMAAVLLLAPLAAKAEGPTRLNSMSVLTQVRDAGCNPADQTAGIITSATPLNTPLYEFLQCRPVLAPDGHQLTLGE